MKVPGSNILAMALSIMGTETIQVRRFITGDLAVNENYLEVAAYADPVDIEAQVQAVDRKLYKQRGLNYDARYIEIWSVSDIDDQISGQALSVDGDTHSLGT